ncbi:unnamed protein product [Moneuplotes crassus]|uniref:Uncharacterized protein n=1 Tax=Euplotes crassus TaxID=5936 RepID=A0AAD1Y0U7_EUPCR|nr:unnamed protein product [Moneuplotes crassus]
MEYKQASRMAPRKYVTSEMVEHNRKLRTLELLIQKNDTNIAECNILVDFMKDIHKNWRDGFKDDKQEIAKLKEEKRQEKTRTKKYKRSKKQARKEIRKARTELMTIEDMIIKLNYKAKLKEYNRIKRINERNKANPDKEFKRELTKIYQRCIKVRGNSLFYEND